MCSQLPAPTVVGYPGPCSYASAQQSFFGEREDGRQRLSGELREPLESLAFPVAERRSLEIEGHTPGSDKVENDSMDPYLGSSYSRPNDAPLPLRNYLAPEIRPISGVA